MAEAEIAADAAVEARVLATLDALGAAYETVRIDPDHADTATFCEVYGFAEADCGNCILVRSREQTPRYAACVVAATARLDVNRTVRRLLDVRKASFAPTDLAESVTEMRSGGVTPFGLPEGLPVFVDAGLLDRPRVVVGGGSRRLKVLVAPEVFRRAPGVEIVEGLAR